MPDLQAMVLPMMRYALVVLMSLGVGLAAAAVFTVICSAYRKRSHRSQSDSTRNSNRDAEPEDPGPK